MKTGFIDWNDEDLSIYVFEKQGSVFELIDAQTIPLDEELNTSHIASVHTTALDNTFISIPMSLLTLREHNFPFSDKDKIQDTIGFELEGLLLGNTSDYVIDHIITETLDTGSKALAVCLEKKRLKVIIELFSAAGLDPKVITCIDLWLCGGNIENLLGKPITDKNVRIEAIRQELLNPSINFRQDELSYTGDVDRFKKNLRTTVALVLVFLIILGIHSFLSLLNTKRENELLTKQITKIYRALYPEDKKIIDIEKQFKGNLNRLKKKKAALGGIPVLDTLSQIATQINRNVTLHEYSTDDKSIMIKGTSRSFEEVESMKNTLSSTFRDVKVVESKATADKKINFTIVMHEKTV